MPPKKTITSDGADPDLDVLLSSATPSRRAAPPAGGEAGILSSPADTLSYDDDLLLAEVLATEAAAASEEHRSAAVDLSGASMSRNMAGPADAVSSSNSVKFGRPLVSEAGAEANARPSEAAGKTTQVTSSGDVSNNNQPDEDVLLRELADLTTAPPAFVGNAQREASRTRQDRVGGNATPQQTKSTASKTTSATSPSSRQHTSKPQQSLATGGSTSTKTGVQDALSMDEEQAVLDAILGSIECQQSTVSGDLTDDVSDAAAKDNRHAYGQRHPPGPSHADEDEEEAEVERILARAEDIAAGAALVDGVQGGGARNKRGDGVLSFHEHTALRRALRPSLSTLGHPTCAVLRPRTFHSEPEKGDDRAKSDRRAATATSGSDATTRVSSLYLALGMSLGGIMLYNDHWGLLGICGSATSSGPVAQRGGVVSLSIPAVPRHTELTIASGHEKGAFVLWSVATLYPLRILTDEFVSPVILTKHLFCDAYRTLCLEAAGKVTLLTYTRVLSKTMFRSTTLVEGHAASPSFIPGENRYVSAGLVGIVDMDVLPFPNAAYLLNSGNRVDQLNRGEEPVLFMHDAPHPTISGGPVPLSDEVDFSACPFVTPGSQLLATASSDLVVLHLIETGLANVCAPIARRAHAPMSLSNPLVRFVLVEQGEPKVLLCVSWNVEVELLRVQFDKEGSAVGMESIAMTQLFAPVHAMCSVASSAVVFVDQSSSILLYDATVAVVAERHSMAAIEPVTYTHRLTGTRYQGALATNKKTAFVLGRERVFSCTLLPWDERLQALLLRKKYPDALDLAVDLSDEVALCAVGLHSDSAKRRMALRRYMEAICIAYCRDTMEAVAQGQAVASTAHAVIRRIIVTCSRMDELEGVFFGKVMPRLRELRQTASAFVVLEECMLKDVVTSMSELFIETFYHFFTTNPAVLAEEDQKNRTVMGDGSPPSSPFSATLAPSGAGSPVEGSLTAAPTHVTAPVSTAVLSGKERAERALMHIETNLDTLEELARAHHLTTLLVVVLSLRRGKYGDALHAALEMQMGTPVNTTGSAATRAAADVTVALNYLRCTFQGSSLLPNHDIPHDARLAAKRQVWLLVVTQPQTFRRLLTEAPSPTVFLGTLVSVLADVGTPFSIWTESHMTLSLKYNVAKVFAALLSVVEDHPSATDRVLFDAEASRLFKPNDVARTLAAGSAVTDMNPSDPTAASTQGAAAVQQPRPPALSYADTVHYFLNSIVDLMYHRRGQFLFPVVTASEEWGAFANVVVANYTYMYETAETPTDRNNLQAQLTRFMRCVLRHVNRPPISFRSYEPVYKGKGMARCLAAVYSYDAEYAKAIDCFLDPDNNVAEPHLEQGVFALLREEALRLERESSRWSDTKAAAQEQASGGDRAASADGTGPVVERSSILTMPPKKAMKRLRNAVMERVTALVRVDATALAQFVFDFLPVNNNEVMRVLKSSSKTFLRYLDELLGKGDIAVANDVNLQNNYIELLCAHEPHRVYDYLTENDQTISYDVQIALRAVRKHRVADAAIFLLEKTLMIEEAMDILVVALREALRNRRMDILHRHIAAAQAEEEVTHGDATGTASSPAKEEKGAEKAGTVQAGGGSKQDHAETQPGHEDSERGAGAVEHLLSVGLDVLSMFKRRTSQDAVGHWFRVLDTIATPRRVLSTWEASLVADKHEHTTDTAVVVEWDRIREFWTRDANELSTEYLSASSAAGCTMNATPPSPLSVSQGFVTAMVSLYAKYISLLLRTMIRTLDLSVVVSKIVEDNEGETFGPFKPIVVDIMGAISFDLEVKRLCLECVGEDLVELGNDLYRHLNTGVVPTSDTCYLCRRKLVDKPPAGAASADGSGVMGGDGGNGGDVSAAVCLYACGHAFHEVCRAMASAIDDRHDCVQCFVERAGSVQGARYAQIAEAAAATAASDAAASAIASGLARPSQKGVPRPDAGSAVLSRRLRQTRSKVDRNHMEHYNVLKGFLSASSAAAAAGGAVGGASDAVGRLWKKEEGAGAPSNHPRLLRAPAPFVPVSLNGVGTAAETVDLTTDDVDIAKLTDAEILELFGDV